MEQVTVIPVEQPGQMKAFVELPWKIYAQDPQWVPPLKKEVAHLLDPQSHPFWQFAQRRLFLARRGPEIVGRIAAIVDHNYNRFHDERMGIWGFFECVDDPAAAAALFAAAEEWVRGQGMTFLRGPLNPSTNYEGGLLVDGFEQPPVFGMTYNPPYYPALVEAQRFTKEKDLLSFRVERGWQPPAWVHRLARRIIGKTNIQMRPFRKENFKNELNYVKVIYHEAWFDNWGFVPMTDAEVEDMGRQLVRIIDPDFCFFLLDGQEPVGVGIVIDDIYPLLKRFNGKVGLLGWLKYLLYRREITGWRGFIFGIRKKYQQQGLPLVAFDYLFRLLMENPKYDKYKYIELGWNLEDNDMINQWYLDGGAKVNKRFRLYRKELAALGQETKVADARLTP
ncbi:MAG: acyl-CoA N-acyltransferase [Deltaproteobacteria bacterium]|nr:MAG: acyl-CoA N-acyltransferase [Deltaproteobacteria bacterium]